MFDQMYELNLKYYKELTMYILAGKKRLAEVRSRSWRRCGRRRSRRVLPRTPRHTTTW